jgi:hypothetical protein
VHIVNEPVPGSDDPDGMALWAGLFRERSSGSVKVGYEWSRFSMRRAGEAGGDDDSGWGAVSEGDD